MNFVTKLNPTGTRSCIRPSSDRAIHDWIDGVDASGNAYISGGTFASDYPTTPGAYDTTFNGGRDVYLTKLNASGSALAYSTYIGGGTTSDVTRAITVDAGGSAISWATPARSWAGAVAPTRRPPAHTTHALRPGRVRDQGEPEWQRPRLLHLPGDAGGESAGDIAVDASGNAYVDGATNSPGYPTTPGAYASLIRGGAFMTELNAAGSALLYSTFLDGDSGSGIAVDGLGGAYMSESASGRASGHARCLRPELQWRRQRCVRAGARSAYELFALRHVSWRQRHGRRPRDRLGLCRQHLPRRLDPVDQLPDHAWGPRFHNRFERRPSRRSSRPPS